METDIRKMIDGLSPVAEFRSNVERTIAALDTRIADMSAMDADDELELEELRELSEFWTRVLEGMSA